MNRIAFTALLVLCSCATKPPPVMLRSAKALASMPPLPKMVKTTTKPIVFSLVCSARQGGMLYSTNGLVSGLVFANSTNSISGLTVIRTNGIQQIHFPPVPVRPVRRIKTAIIPTAPVLIAFWIPWDSEYNIFYVDNMNLQTGSNYTDQVSIDLKVWGDLTHFTWTSTDPSEYNRVAVVVPATVTAFKNVRAKMQ